MAGELIINASLPETRIALMENGEIQELLIERASGKGIVGNIYKGRVTRVLPGMQAAFVDIGLEKAAFLYVDDVYVHSEIWEEEEGSHGSSNDLADVGSHDTDVTPPVTTQGVITPVTPVTQSGTQIVAPVSSPGQIVPVVAPVQHVAPQVILPLPTVPGAVNPAPVVPVVEGVLFSTEAGAPTQDVSAKDDSVSSATESAVEAQPARDIHEELHEELHGEEGRGDDEDGDDRGPVKMAASPSSRGRKKADPNAAANAATSAPASEPSQNAFEMEMGSSNPEGTLAPSQEDSKSTERASRKESAEGVVASSEAVPAISEAPTVQAESQGESSNASGDLSGTEDESAAGIEEGAVADGGEGGDAQAPGRRRHRRGRRGGRLRRRPQGNEGAQAAQSEQGSEPVQQKFPENFREQMADSGDSESDRSDLAEEQEQRTESGPNLPQAGRPEAASGSERSDHRSGEETKVQEVRADFKATRSRDRRIRVKTTARPVRAQINIQDLLKEGQEILVQVAKDPISTKGARLTCHISLPGRHLVCMPTIDHVGVSRRIEREDERRRLREYVERNRPKNLGFIVRTASGKQQSEKRIKQDIEYLTRLWTEIKEKAAPVTAPALVYEDLNSVLRAIRDWVTEEIDKIIVDSRYHFNEIQRFVSHFMPSLKQKVDLYHGDVPIFDAYGLSTELSRSLERKVWLKSGGYIVVDQAEALVAIDVNTGRYVGKKNLEDTILKTNLEAVQEIAYQLRLRNCGGIIILDLIDMEKEENKQRVYRALEEALAKDRARPTIMKISDLGLVEMTRKRTRDTIIRTLCESCTHCEGKGFVKSKQTVAYEIMREVEREGIERDVNKILVQAHPDVIDILAIDERETLDQLERRYRKQIYLQAVTDFHPEQFEVTADKREGSEKGREQPQGREQNQERGRGRQRSQHQNRQNHDNNKPQPIPDSLKLGRLEAASAASIIVTSGEHGYGSAQTSGEGQPVVVAVTPSPVITIRPVISSPSGNSAGNGPTETDRENAGNIAGPGNTKDSSIESSFEEEDRLAFLRAQAAQDAALARLGNSSGSHPSRNLSNDGGAPRNDRGGGRRPARGQQRPGKFRRNDRGHGNMGNHDGSQGRGHKAFNPNHQQQKWVDPVRPVSSPVSVAEIAKSGADDGVKSGGSGSGDSQPQF